MPTILEINVREGFWIAFWYGVGLLLPTIGGEELRVHLKRRRYRLDRLLLA